MNTNLRLLTASVFAGLSVFALTARATVYTDTWYNFGSGGTPMHRTTNTTGGVMSAFNSDGSFTPIMNDVGNPSSGYSGLNGVASGVHNAVTDVRNFVGPINSLADATNPNATYFEFTLAPASGLQLVATDFEVGSRGKTGFGPTTLTLVASTDSFAANFTQLGTMTLTANNSWALYNLPSFNYSAPIDIPVTFRIYGTDGTASLGSQNWRIDDVTLSLVAVPEPSTYMAFLLGVVWLGARAWHRRRTAAR